MRYLIASFLIACGVAACDSGQQTDATGETSPMAACETEMSDPACKQCCLKAGATEYDYDSVDDGDPRCTCVKPTR